MKQDEIMRRVGSAYGSLLRPDPSDAKLHADIQVITALVPEIEPADVSMLIVDGDSWRERLVGLVLATRMDSVNYVPAMVASLRSPRALAIVPTLAAMAVGVSARRDAIPDGIAELDRSAFSGELGWALDHFLFHVGKRVGKPSGFSPNDGQDFGVHVRLFETIRATR